MPLVVSDAQTHRGRMEAEETEIIAVDVGGTHARFARALLVAGKPPRLTDTVKFRVADFPSLQAVWGAYRDSRGGALPTDAAIAVAVPLGADVVHFTNSPWTFRPSTLATELRLQRLTLLNDFGAMAHAVAWFDDALLQPIMGPSGPLPTEGVTSVIGPGTGLGVAMLLRREGHIHVIETEGAHIDFAPLDDVEQRILDAMRRRFGRVSAERIVSGPGLDNLYSALAPDAPPLSDAALWDAAVTGNDPTAVLALDRLVLSFGSVAGDLALAHGANAVVLAGGLANRIADHLRKPGFANRFIAKGRYTARMQSFPVRLATHPEPGLLGAATAFQREYLPR